MTGGAFCPNGTTVQLTVVSGAGSSRVALPAYDEVCGVVRILQSGTPAVHIRFGDSSVNATTNDMPVGQEEHIFKVPPGATHIAGIGGSASLYITAGQV